MPQTIERTILKIPVGYRSPEVASFVSQLDDLTKLLRTDLRGVSVRELEWQPAAGMNTIGMLLAHMAIVEIWWIESAVRRIAAANVDFKRHIGIGPDDDGIPVPPRGGHPQSLAGKPLAFYLRLIKRGRDHLRKVAKGITPEELQLSQRRIRRDNKVQIYNDRWVLYHLVEHFAGHYGQVLLLRHSYRARAKRA